MAVGDSVAQDQLRAFIERIERMEEEKAAIAADIREIYAEAKGNGFDTKILRKIVTIRKQDANERMEQEALLELYMDALGMQLAHDSAMNDRLHGGSRSAPLFAGRVDAISEPITEPQPAPQAGAGVEASSWQDDTDAMAPVESAPEISTPIRLETANEAETACAPVAPCSDEHGDGNGLRLKGEEGRTLGAPSVGVRNDGALAAGASTQREDRASPAPSLNETGKSAEASASAALLYAAPGVVVMETTPPEGALAHPYAACWPVRDIDVAGGVREPIVKIGKLILDGRGRMFAARGVDGGKGIAYPVVQYDGTDPLLDCIRWNLKSRPGIHQHNLKIIAHKLMKIEPSRADDIMRAFGLEVAEAAE